METGGVPQGTVEYPLTEGALYVPGRQSIANVEHGGDNPGDGMDGPGPNSKGYHRDMRHRTVRDPMEGGRGPDQHSPPRQPVDARHPTMGQVRKRYRDGYNGVKACLGVCHNRPRPPIHGIYLPQEGL